MAAPKATSPKKAALSSSTEGKTFRITAELVSEHYGNAQALAKELSYALSDFSPVWKLEVEEVA